MTIVTKQLLLGSEHYEKALPGTVFFQRLVYLLLILGHRAADTMPPPFIFAHVDTWARYFSHYETPAFPPA